MQHWQRLYVSSLPPHCDNTRMVVVVLEVGGQFFRKDLLVSWADTPAALREVAFRLEEMARDVEVAFPSETYGSGVVSKT